MPFSGPCGGAFSDVIAAPSKAGIQAFFSVKRRDFLADVSAPGKRLFHQ
jgi:hypothetical protein